MFLTLILEQCGFVPSTNYGFRNGPFWKEENDYIITITPWCPNSISLSLKSQETLISAYTQIYNFSTMNDGRFFIGGDGRTTVYTKTFLSYEEDLIMNYSEVESAITNGLSKASDAWNLIHTKGPFSYFNWNIFHNHISYNNSTKLREIRHFTV